MQASIYSSIARRPTPNMTNAPYAVSIAPRLRHTPAPDCGCGRSGAGTVGQATSHFSAVLDQHYPQAVMFSLYACSSVNSRREFRTEMGKSSTESDVGDALRSPRG